MTSVPGDSAPGKEAGLGLLPDTKPQSAAPVSPAELERRHYLPPGVLTAPYRAPEPPKTSEKPE